MWTVPGARTRGRRTRGIAAGVVLAWAAACNQLGGPAAPTSGPFSIPDVLAPSLALLDADSRPIPFVGETAATWFRRNVRGVVLDDALPPGVRARCCGPDRIIHWSTAWLPDPTRPRDVRIAAGLLLHEARHADGFRHSCPDLLRDRTFDEGGAWAVHAAWLELAGEAETAWSIRTAEIGCR